jgi:regulator of sirC expression with transglutaminase-like and TPR domain
MTREEIEKQITLRMPLEEFLRIQERLAVLRKDEDMKLKALAELQKAYLAANTDEQQEMVKYAVAQIREISRKTREEIRALNSKIYEHMPLADAKDLYEKYLASKAG